MPDSYKPADASRSPRFSGVRTFMRLPHVRDLSEPVDFVVLGIPFDTAQSYRTGARFGPQAIRDFSVLLRPYNVQQQINLFDYISGLDYGDLDTVPGNIHQTYNLVVEQLLPIVEQGIIPVAMGGDHSISLGELRALSRVYGPLSLVHFDAHSDTWDGYWGEKYTHGTPFRRAAEEELLDPHHSIQIGMRGSVYSSTDLQVARDLGYEVYSTDDLFELGVEEMVRRIHKRVNGRRVFVSFDVDFLDPVYAPGTGTPEVGGPSIRDGLDLVRGLAGLDIVGFDCVEVLPAYDPSQLTAAAAANIMYEMVTLIALSRRDGAQG